MFEYLPELMKGLHTSLTPTIASLIVALILVMIFYHHPDAENAGAGVAGALYHAVYRYAAAGADLP